MIFIRGRNDWDDRYDEPSYEYDDFEDATNCELYALVFCIKAKIDGGRV